MGRLEGKIALVTGVGRGIGRAISERFAQEGATLALVDREQAALVGVASALCTNGREHLQTCFDVTDPGEWMRAVQKIESSLGRLDILVNNAGVAQKPTARIHELDLEAWDRVININLRSVFIALKCCIPLMLKSGGGSIVNLASLASFMVYPESSAYMASKGGVMQLTRTAALEYVHDNIRVNAVCPGATHTTIMDEAGPEITKVVSGRVPMGRMGRPQEIAALALFLASDDASYITGGAYIIDGGRSAGPM